MRTSDWLCFLRHGDQVDDRGGGGGGVVEDSFRRKANRSRSSWDRLKHTLYPEAVRHSATSTRTGKLTALPEIRYSCCKFCVCSCVGHKGNLAGAATHRERGYFFPPCNHSPSTAPTTLAPPTTATTPMPCNAHESVPDRGLQICKAVNSDESAFGSWFVANHSRVDKSREDGRSTAAPSVTLPLMPMTPSNAHFTVHHRRLVGELRRTQGRRAP